ncbi:MAG: VOC family protein [Candidatus Babeliaceae bacterium]|nr:VOC family protein [Candidatus Babeliaceae bacterium]
MKCLMPDLMVNDVIKTVAFYRDFLGFRVLRVFPETGVPAWALVQKGNVEIMFQEREGLIEEYSLPPFEFLGGSFVLYMVVPDLDAFYEAIKSNGQIKIVRDMHGAEYGAQRFAIEDCNGYVLVFQDK